MSSAKCQCMATNPGPAMMSPSISTRPAIMPCPCKKCQDRARDLINVRNQSIADSKSGICGKRINGVPIGRPMDNCMGYAGKGPETATGSNWEPDRNTEKCQSFGATKIIPGMDPGRGPELVLGMVTGTGSETGSETGSGMGPGMGSAMSSGMEPSGYQPHFPGGVAFGSASYGRKSSMGNSSRRDESESLSLGSGCLHSLDYGGLDTKFGRDTLGLLVHLKGNKGILNASSAGTCSKHTACDRRCGVDTECFPVCKKKVANGIESGSDGFGGTAGIRVCSNEYINMFINCLLEVLGILVFFAICTIAFWLTLGYHLVQLLISLFQADRSVQMAIGIVLALLMLACAVSLSTQPGGVSPISSCSKCSKQNKSTTTNQCKLSIFAKIKATLPVLAKKQQQQSNNRGTRRYSDCQGRKIFNNSRRSAILTEMKQPPTWIIWLGDCVNRFFCR